MERVRVLGITLLVFSLSLAYFALVMGRNIARPYFLFLVLAAVLGVLCYRTFRLFSQMRVLEELQESWGKKRTRARDFDSISQYYRLKETRGFTIDDRTWSDLDMDRVYEAMDGTLTFPGSQYLFSLLREPLFTEEPLRVRGKRIETLEDAKVRQKLQLPLHELGHKDGEDLAAFLWDLPSVDVPPLWRYTLLAGLALCSPLFVLFWGANGFLLLFGIFAFNMKVHYQEEKKILGHLSSLKYLSRMLYCAEELQKGIPEDKEFSFLVLKDDLFALRGLRRVLGVLSLKGGDPNLEALLDYLRILFLLDVRSFYRAYSLVSTHRERLQRVFESIGALDAMLALSSYKKSLAYSCEPTQEEGTLAFTNAYHPLVNDPVSNSFSGEKGGTLITGSNMSGKSTFLRMVGVNALLSQTAFFCHAKTYSSPFVKLLTSIGRTDNLIEGTSYYLDEARSVLRLVESVESSGYNLCILDEIFRGTNSGERIAGGATTLDYLAKKQALVFVASHDLELTRLLTSLYDNYHFQETMGSRGLEFDYELRSGPSTTRNALSLLAHLGYPKEITEGAMKVLQDEEGRL